MFRINQEYERIELLDFIGSKQVQSGVIWGYKEPGCVIITSGGRDSKRHGYGDSKNPDGSWLYIGRGAKGDQSPNGFGNALLISGEKSVLLFSTREPRAEEVRKRGNHKKLYRFEGIFEVGSWTFYAPINGKRANNKLIQYHLIPAENIYGEDDIKPIKVVREPIGLYKLRDKIKNKERKPALTAKTNIIEYRLRSLQIKQYAILRAKGICENCNQSAPFFSIENLPFLEMLKQVLSELIKEKEINLSNQN